MTGAGDAGVGVGYAVGFTVGISGVGTGVGVGVVVGVGSGVCVAVSQMDVPCEELLLFLTVQMSFPSEMLPKRELPSAVIFFAPDASFSADPNCSPFTGAFP